MPRKVAMAPHQRSSSPVSKQRALVEIALVVATGIGKFIFVDLLHAKGFFVIGALAFWVIYVLRSAGQNRFLLRDWGFQYDGFWKSFYILLPVAIICIAAFTYYGIRNDTLIFNWNILPTLLLYPLWGIIQQFLMMALIAGNLQRISEGKLNDFIISFLTAVAFAVVHFPSIPLVVATFGLAIVYASVYLKYKNLFALGIYHGWLGCFYYYFVLKRDAWLEFVSRFLSAG